MLDNGVPSARHRYLALAGMLLVALLLACGPTSNVTSPTSTTLPDGTTAGPPAPPSAQVRRNISGVTLKLPQDASPSLLDTDAWQTLIDGSQVNADGTGEGWLQISNCMLIYLFQDSSLVKATCPKAEAATGNVTCALAGTSVYNNSCSSKIVIQTGSAEIELAGTWISVTYLPDRNLTLVMVFDEPDKQSRASVRAVLEPNQWTMDAPTDVLENHFWFSTPGNAAAPVASLAARVPHPLADLDPLVAELGLERWMERIIEHARVDGIQLPATLLQTPTHTATVTPTNTPTSTPTNTPTLTPTNRPPIAATNTPTRTPTITPTNTPTWTPTITPTNTPTWTPTNTPTTPPPEVCDGIDNDGDGEVDEGFSDLTGDGDADCVDADDDNDGISDTAEQQAGSDPRDARSTPEICDGQDNDLDRMVDEGSIDTDRDGQADCVDEDDDNDRYTDTAEAATSEGNAQGSNPLDPRSVPEVKDCRDNDGNEGIDEGLGGPCPSPTTPPVIIN